MAHGMLRRSQSKDDGSSSESDSPVAQWRRVDLGVPSTSSKVCKTVKYQVPTLNHLLDSVHKVAKSYLQNNNAQILEFKAHFKNWENKSDKSTVSYMYGSDGFKAIYTQKLFSARIKTMNKAMKYILFNKDAPQKDVVISIMTKASRYISLGCGPGPCISSVIMVLRQDLHLTHEITFVGLDQFTGWQPYIDSLDAVDELSTVTFKKMTINEESVNELPEGDVVIMSYTDASIHTPGFWEKLRQRYTLILILDQNKAVLHDLLRRQQFRPVEYQMKGFKRFYYQVCRKNSRSSLSLDTSEPNAKRQRLSPNDEEMPIAQLQELTSCGIDSEVAKTKCGTGSGRYAGALEPQKRMTVERMNQLLRAKMIALGEDVSSPDTLDTKSESESSIKQESEEDTVISDLFSGFENFMEEFGETLANVKSEPDLQVKTELETGSPPSGQSIPVLTHSMSKTFNHHKDPIPIEVPAEFLDNPIFHSDSTPNSTEPKNRSPTKSPRVTNGGAKATSSSFDLRNVLSARRRIPTTNQEKAKNVSKPTGVADQKHNGGNRLSILTSQRRSVPSNTNHKDSSIRRPTTFKNTSSSQSNVHRHNGQSMGYGANLNNQYSPNNTNQTNNLNSWNNPQQQYTQPIQPSSVYQSGYPSSHMTSSTYNTTPVSMTSPASMAPYQPYSMPSQVAAWSQSSYTNPMAGGLYYPTQQVAYSAQQQPSMSYSTPASNPAFSGVYNFSNSASYSNGSSYPSANSGSYGNGATYPSTPNDLRQVLQSRRRERD